MLPYERLAYGARNATACGRTTSRVRRLRAFVRLSRPLFLYGGFAGVALGAAIAAYAGARIDPTTYIWVQAMVTSFHLMVHYANDYFDRESDAQSLPAAWSGGSGVLVSGALAPRVALIAALICAALGVTAVAHFAVSGARTVAGIGLTILVLAWSYSAPPLRLAARGLGELDTALVVAVLVPAAGCAAFTGGLTGAMLYPLSGPALAMLAMMLCVELPDAGIDYLADKRNLAVRIGPSSTWNAVLALAPTSALFAAVQAYRVAGGAGLGALLVAIGFALALIRAVRGDPRPGTVAFLGVGLYAATVTGLAVAYALGTAAR